MAAVAPAAASSARGNFALVPEIRRRRLRVGVFAARALQPAWIAQALAKVAACDFAEISVVCCAHSPAPSGPALWRAYRAADRWLFGGESFEGEVDIGAIVPAARRRDLLALTARELSACDLAGLDLDVAIALGDFDDAALDGVARFGTWRHSFGREHAKCDALAGVREVIDAEPVTGSGIRVRLGDGRPDRLAYESWARTLPLSVAQSRANVFAKSSQFLVRVLRELHAHGGGWLERATREALPSPEEAFPPLARVATGIARIGGRMAQRALHKAASVEQWSLAFRFTADEPWDGALEGFHHLVPPADRFWADPFPIERNGRHFIFFEELPFATGKGHISVLEVDRAGRASKPAIALERDHHLSYPFLVEDGGELYMIPESAWNHTIEVWRCVDFPLRWKRERVLLEGVFCADATLARAGGRWWMFANSCVEGAEIHDELHLFSADRLLGEWKPHRANPVKSDVRGSRPAGRLFTRDGALYRPAQVCAPIYGAGIALNRVTRLDDEAYAEEEVRRIVPAGGLLGMHTINRAGALSVADAFARRPRFGAARRAPRAPS